MANLTRLSILIAESDAERSSEVARLLEDLGVERVLQVDSVPALQRALQMQAFDVLLCAERLDDEAGVAVLRGARKLAPATRAVLMRPGERAAELVPEDIEAIALPFSRLSLQGLLHGSAAPEGGLWCEVPALSLADILQMYHQARRSITVLLSGPIAGRILLESGEIVDAESNEEQGVAALSRLLEAESGLLRTAPADPSRARTVFAPFQSVILEAAQKLDERRRDSRLNIDTTSVSSAVLRSTSHPGLQAHAPNPQSFVAPLTRRRRQSWVAVVSVAGVLAAAFGAATYLGQHLDSSGRSPHGPGSRGAAADESARVEQAAQALAPPPSGGERPQPELLTPIETDSDPNPPERFELRITSKPSRATVTEAGRVLGMTPLSLTVAERSVAGRPREFVVRAPGYLSGRVVQGASASNVDRHVVLSTRPAALDGEGGGSLNPNGQAAESRSTPPSGKRKDLDIRLRR